MIALDEQQRIALVLRKARENKKFTQAELGNLLGVSKKVISDYELAKVNTIPFKNRIQLAIILDIQINELLYDEEKVKGYPNELQTESGWNETWAAMDKAREYSILTAQNGRTLAEALYKVACAVDSNGVGLSSQTLEHIYRELFIKRGLSKADALAMSKFFTWLCIEQPRVLSHWHDKMLLEKMSADKNN